jgi:hypothetical protein
LARKTTGTDNQSDTIVSNFHILALRRSVDIWLRLEGVRVEHHWWNGDVRLQRRDVYVRTDGELWEVEAQMGGPSGKSKVQSCPGKASALILADAWRGPRWQWRKL